MTSLAIVAPAGIARETPIDWRFLLRGQDGPTFSAAQAADNEGVIFERLKPFGMVFFTANKGPLMFATNVEYVEPSGTARP